VSFPSPCTTNAIVPDTNHELITVFRYINVQMAFFFLVRHIDQVWSLLFVIAKIIGLLLSKQ